MDSGATLEDSSGMDVEAEAVRDAENNINTARWAGAELAEFSFTLYQKFTSKFTTVRRFSLRLAAYV